MDRNRDGVVTIDEFIETCQKVIRSSNWTETQFPESMHLFSCIFFLLFTGWKYNGFHAALWKRHLVSVEGRGSVFLQSAHSCRPLAPKSILTKRIGRATHFAFQYNLVNTIAFPVELFHAEKCKEFPGSLKEEIILCMTILFVFCTGWNQLSMIACPSSKSMWCKPRSQTRVLSLNTYFVTVLYGIEKNQMFV